MIIGIHPDHFGKESYAEKWAEFLRQRGVEVRFLDLLSPHAIEQARSCDGVMWRWFHDEQHKQSARPILYAIEHYLGIAVYPDTATSWHFDNKIAQMYMLQALGAPMPQTWLFWDEKQASEWAPTASYPLVFKLSVGAGASNVLRVENQREAITLIERSFRQSVFPMTMNEYRKVAGWPGFWRRAGDAARYAFRAEYPSLHQQWWKPERGYVYFQEFLPGNDYDTRIAVIGNRAFGFRRMNRPGDFRASGSGAFQTDPELVDRRCIEIALGVSAKAQYQCMAYDFLLKDGRPVICEVSYGFVDWAVHECPGHWDNALNWHPGQMWPEQAQVDLFLARINATRESA